MILYFSATGNSKYCAEQIAAATKDPLFSLHSAMKNSQFEIDCKSALQLIIISPVYDMGMSWAVKEYLEAAEFRSIPKECYICAVFTCGKSCGIAANEMREALHKKGLWLNAAYAICMPDTYIPMFPLPSQEKQQEIFAKAEQILPTVISKIQNHAAVFELPPGMPSPLAKIIRKINIPKQRKTDRFWVKENCIGCRLCEYVCPMNIIQIKDGKPVWTKDGCACCLGCIHRCPQQAIQYGNKTEDRGRYINPHVKL